MKKIKVDDKKYRVLTHGLPVNEEECKAVKDVVDKIIAKDIKYLNKLKKNKKK